MPDLSLLNLSVFYLIHSKLSPGDEAMATVVHSTEISLRLKRNGCAEIQSVCAHVSCAQGFTCMYVCEDEKTTLIVVLQVPSTLLFLKNIYLFLHLFLCMHTHAWHSCAGQMPACGSWEAKETELKSLGLAACTFMCWVILLDPPCVWDSPSLACSFVLMSSREPPIFTFPALGL